jgi:hypothetical protein
MPHTGSILSFAVSADHPRQVIASFLETRALRRGGIPGPDEDGNVRIQVIRRLVLDKGNDRSAEFDIRLC